MSEQKYISFSFCKSEINPHFADNLSAVNRLSCHNTDKSNTDDAKRILLDSNRVCSQLFIVNPMPRRFYKYVGLNAETMIYDPLNTDSNKQRAMHMNKRLMNWSQVINHGWQKKSFSVLFITLTMADANNDIATFLNHYRIKLRRLHSIEIFSYAWVLEFGSNGTNPHYHLSIVVNRTKDLKKFCPKSMGIWTGFVKTEFVKKDVARYMSKYLQKGDLIVCNRRRFGVSNMVSTVNYWFDHISQNEQKFTRYNA